MNNEENAEARADELMHYIERLNSGEPLEHVRQDFREKFGSVDASVIVEAEKNLIQRGTSVMQVQKLCDIHSALFHGNTREEKIMNAENAVQQSLKNKAAASKEHPMPANVEAMPSAKSASVEGHPLNVLTLENNEFVKRLDKLEDLLKEGADAGKVLASLKDIALSGAHYDKKDELILPPLKRHGVSGPADVMWNVDVELRKTNGSLIQALGMKPEEELTADLREKVKKLSSRMREMIFKEEKILFPLAEKNFTAGEWQLIYRDMPRFGLSWIHGAPAWKDAENTGIQEAAISADGAVKDAEIQLPTGKLSLAELAGILRTLPVELTFIDANDTNRYFSEDSSLFPRALSALGHNVYECHPPKVLPVVKNVIEQLKSGEKDVISFVAPKHGRTAFIRYMAVRSEKGEYLGVLEVVEDITDLK